MHYYICSILYSNQLQRLTIIFLNLGKNIPVADLEFSADIQQRQTVNVRLPNQNNYEWTVSLFADFRELKNDVILHPRVATIKYYWDEDFNGRFFHPSLHFCPTA